MINFDKTIGEFTLLKIKQKLTQGYMQVNKQNFISCGKIDSKYYMFIYSNLFIIVNLCQGLLFSGKQQSTKHARIILPVRPNRESLPKSELGPHIWAAQCSGQAP